ncbi:MAG: bifunctional acetate--CoA ligase family protein/GNAT family N-acetyltransferase [Thioalkalivibrio sp.]|nr:bifunctional acetate--CoA ligase family protein/GNAT family N-acetyltransferase [Thioalkalivibrio sp.]
MTATPATNTDPSYDILRSDYLHLRAIFAPRSIALIGATDRPGSVGRTLFWNLLSHPFGGTVYPVNAKRRSVLGIRAYPSISEVPEPVDLAIVATPAATVPGVIRECVANDVRGAIVISAGFREIGPEGLALEDEIRQALRNSALRVIGPNCLGVMSPRTGLNATFSGVMAQPGHVAFISQSGAVGTAVLDWSRRENVGFSNFASIGSMLDVNWGDLIYYLGDDPNTRSIVIYMESIGDARPFLSAAREVALTKPIIVIKAGRTEAAAKAAASHTGSLAGSDRVLDAAFRRCGVLRVDSLAEMFDVAEVLAKQIHLPQGPRLTILTNAGGPGVLSTDSLIQGGGELTPLEDDTINALDEVVPAHWSRGNPIDILGDADPERYALAFERAAVDPNADGILVILTPQAMTDPTRTAELIKCEAEGLKKPVLASWMGGAEVFPGTNLLNQARIPTYSQPDAAAHLFNLMWRYHCNLKALYETPTLAMGRKEIGVAQARVQRLLETAREMRRTLLTEFESKTLLQTYGIPIVETRLAATAEEAVRQAADIGYPVVLKLHSETLTHKTDVGGVRLNLTHAGAVTEAFRRIQSSVAERAGADHFQGVTVQPMVNRDESYELILGSSPDPQFGPVLLFGAGGQMVEVLRDTAVALPPLTTTLARRLMEQTRIHEALKGVRGRPAVNLAQLERLLVRFSQLIVEHPEIREIDINPLLASPDTGDGANTISALDARVLLHDADLDLATLPPLAIRPYPAQYASDWTLHDGRRVTIRPIRPEDEPLLAAFHKTLSERSVYLRYFHIMQISQRVAHERLTRLCFTDYDRQMALVVVYRDPADDERRILGVGRWSRLNDSSHAEFSMLINDQDQRQGIGTELLRRLTDIAREEGIVRITADILAENEGMQRVCRKVGFRLDPPEEGTISAEILLRERRTKHRD